MSFTEYEISLFPFPLLGQALSPIWYVASYDIVVKL